MGCQYANGSLYTKKTALLSAVLIAHLTYNTLQLHILHNFTQIRNV